MPMKTNIPRYILLLTILWVGFSLRAQQQPVGARHVSLGLVSRTEQTMSRALEQWQAGEIVTADAVRAFGLNRCFGIDTLSDAVFARMQNKSYPARCSMDRAQLRYIRTLHYDAEGRMLIGEMVCNRTIAEDLLAIFRQLYEHRYPIERMVLIDNYEADDERSMRSNNSSCFCYRSVSGSKTLSLHSRGLAVDINTLYNPYVKRRADGTLYVQPETARPYINRERTFPYKIAPGDLLYRLFIQHGFRWGGHWRSCKDYQHFEKPQT